MREIRENIEQDITISEDASLHGIVIGQVSVDGGVELCLLGMIIGNMVSNQSSRVNMHGTVNGKIHIHEHSTVYLHGMVNGDVINDGGLLEVYGTIKGRLFRERGQTFIHENAKIKEM